MLEFAKHRINAERIARHWEDILRIAGSLKLATIGAPELVRSLLKSDRPSNLAKAIDDLERIPETIYTLMIQAVLAKLHWQRRLTPRNFAAL